MLPCNALLALMCSSHPVERSAKRSGLFVSSVLKHLSRTVGFKRHNPVFGACPLLGGCQVRWLGVPRDEAAAGNPLALPSTLLGRAGVVPPQFSELCKEASLTRSALDAVSAPTCIFRLKPCLARSSADTGHACAGG